MDFKKCNAPKAVTDLQGDVFYFGRFTPTYSPEEVTVVQGSQFYYGRFTPRASPEVHSSGRYYRSSEGTFPFRQEMQPGTPKHPPENDIIVPPLNPPPVVQSSGLPQRRPCVDRPKDSKRWWWTRFWKRSKKDRRDEKYPRTHKGQKRIQQI